LTWAEKKARVIKTCAVQHLFSAASRPEPFWLLLRKSESREERRHASKEILAVIEGNGRSKGFCWLL
jgi:hypothetical protein